MSVWRMATIYSKRIYVLKNSLAVRASPDRVTDNFQGKNNSIKKAQPLSEG